MSFAKSRKADFVALSSGQFRIGQVDRHETSWAASDTTVSGVCRNRGGVDIGTLGQRTSSRNCAGSAFGFIFPRYNLLSTLSATETWPFRRILGVDKKARLDRAKSLLADLGLPDKLENKPTSFPAASSSAFPSPGVMNGGSIILADEPTGALDSKSGENVMDISPS